VLDQLVIAVLGVGALVCSQTSIPRVQRWSCILGLTGLTAQPFWVYTGSVHSQWGMVFLSALYTLGYLYGLYNFWIVPKGKKK